MTRKYTSDSIVTLEGLDKIIQSPGIYVGDVGTHRSLFQIIKEVVDNSNDEAPFGDSDFLIKIIFFIDKESGRYQCAVIDNGFGIPVDKLKPAFTEEGTSGKYNNQKLGSAYKRSSGTFGRGVKATAGLSDLCYVVSQHKGDNSTPPKSSCLVVKDAKIDRSEIFDRNTGNGVLVVHEPSSKYFLTIPTFINGGGLKIFIEYVELLAMLDSKTNIVVYKKDGLLPSSFFKKDHLDIWDFFKNFNDQNGKLIYKSKRAEPLDYLKEKLNIKSDFVFRSYMEYDRDPIAFNIHFALTADFETIGNTKFISSINNVPIDTIESHHILTFIDSLKERLSNLSDSLKIQKFIKNNYKLPICLFISAYWNGASFQDLVKSSFKDSKFSGMYYSTLDQIFKQENYVKEIEQLYELLQYHIQDEYDKYTNKNLISLKGSKNLGGQLVRFDAYSPCRVKDSNIAELYIVEGMSAFTGLKQAGPGENQALFAAQGKLLNSFKKEKEDVFRNKILRDLTLILGIRPGDPIENINFKKIFIAADPDSNGAHIVDLLIGDLYTINPAILENGYVYMITSPMYNLVYKQKSTFIKDQDTLFEFKVKTVFQYLFDFKIAAIDKNNEYKISDLNSDYEILTFCRVIFKIGKAVETISHRLNIEPLLLEKLIGAFKFLDPVDEVRLKEHLKYDRVVYSKDTNTLLLVQDDIEVVILMSSIMSEVTKNILPIYRKYMKHTWEPYVVLKDNPSALSNMMTVVELYYLLKSGLKDIHVSKFKGLGGMSPRELGPACLSPATRSYIQITSLGDIQIINKMLGKDSDARKKLL